MEKILVHIHLYYYEQTEMLLSKLRAFGNRLYDLYVTMRDDDPDVIGKVRTFRQDAQIVKTKNVGADIYPFVHILNQVNLDDYDYIVKLHTKRNVDENFQLNKRYDTLGGRWRNYLLSFLTRQNIDTCITAFEADEHLGLTGDYRCIMDNSSDDSKIKFCLDRATLLLKKKEFAAKNIKFVAGSMFMARAKLFKVIRDMKLTESDFSEVISGSDASLAHVLERFFGAMFLANGYELKDVYSSKFWITMSESKLFAALRYFSHLFYQKNRKIRILRIPLFYVRKFKYLSKLSVNKKNDYIEYILGQRNDKREFVPLSAEHYTRTDGDPKPIAFYLPQYHQIPLNDKWHGRGFTEWTNCTKTVPQFAGHYQPHLPIDVGFYNLENTNIMHRQIELAKQYGVYGFCFYYYWFQGTRVLEKPIFNFLADKSLDIPFCFFWANEAWSNTCDPNSLDHGYDPTIRNGDAQRFFDDILPFMKDSRYITREGKPLLIIYRHKDENIAEFVKTIKELATQNGLPGIYVLMFNEGSLEFNPSDYNADAGIEFPPNNLPVTLDYTKKIVNKQAKITVFDMEKLIREKKYMYDVNYPLYKTVFPNWDNTSRKIGNDAHVLQMTPAMYYCWLSDVIRWTQENHASDDRFIFINAWNEWAEGAHLEPDHKYGYANLEMTRRALMGAKWE